MIIDTESIIQLTDPNVEAVFKKLFALAEMPYDRETLNAQTLDALYQAIHSKVQGQNAEESSETGTIGYTAPGATAGMQKKPIIINKGHTHTAAGFKPNVLMIGELGIINHQVKSFLGRAGYKVTIARSLESAEEEFQNQDYPIAIVDLFMPTEKDGFIVIESLVKKAFLCGMDLKIYVISNPARDKKLEREVYSHGGHFYIQREEKWQNKLLGAIENPEDYK